MEKPIFITERVARIAASLEMEPEQRAEILAANDLDEEGWERVENEHDEACDTALGAGDTSKLEAYDAAYISRVEEERGPITPQEYASVVVASRYGQSGARLAELEIPEAAEVLLMRVFEARLEKDEDAARVVREAIEV